MYTPSPTKREAPASQLFGASLPVDRFQGLGREVHGVLLFRRRQLVGIRNEGSGMRDEAMPWAVPFKPDHSFSGFDEGAWP